MKHQRLATPDLTGYGLSRAWFDFCFENPELTSAYHTTLYFYIIDSWNRFGQKEKFGLPTRHTMESLGISSKKTYYKSLNFLVEHGFIIMIQKAKNQNTSCVIKINGGNFNASARTSALDLANTQRIPKRSTHSITSKQINQETIYDQSLQEHMDKIDNGLREEGK